MQALNSNERFNFQDFCLSKDPKDKLPNFELKGNLFRERFNENRFPKAGDPELTAYQCLVVGLAIVHKTKIASKDHAKQKSFCRVILDGLKGFSGRKARVVYVCVKCCDPNQTYEILLILKNIEEH